MTQDKYKKYDDKCKKFIMRLRKDNDADIIAWLAAQASASAEIKRLIREEIQKGH